MATNIWISTGTTSSAQTFNTAGNWSTGSAPVNNDTVIFTGSAGSANVSTNLATGLTGLLVIVDQSYAGYIGNIVNGASVGLQIAGSLIVGRDTGSTTAPAGSRQLLFDGTSNALSVTVLNTASSSANSVLPPVIIQGSNVTVNMTGGVIGLAATPGTTFGGVLNIVDGPSTVVPSVFIGNGATLSTVTASAGTITSNSDNTLTNLSLSGSASITTYGLGAITTASVGTGASFKHYGAGNITTLSVNGIFDRTGDTRPITITTSNLYGGSQFAADNGKSASITRTNFNLVNCRISEVQISLPLGEKP